jgi:periplasmic protein TonB
MRLHTPRFTLTLRALQSFGLLALAVWLSGCTLLQPKAPPSQVAVPAPVEQPPQAVYTPPPQPSLVSRARSPRDYRRDGAEHLYKLNQNRIYHGKLPPLLQAVGVVRVDIDYLGRIQAIRWMRAPDHVPAVRAEIERTIRAAEPFPAPVDMGQVAYTDVWLWHKSGLFQLDTLTEGQRDK